MQLINVALRESQQGSRRIHTVPLAWCTLCFWLLVCGSLVRMWRHFNRKKRLKAVRDCLRRLAAQACIAAARAARAHLQASSTSMTSASWLFSYGATGVTRMTLMSRTALPRQQGLEEGRKARHTHSPVAPTVAHLTKAAGQWGQSLSVLWARSALCGHNKDSSNLTHEWNTISPSLSYPSHQPSSVLMPRSSSPLFVKSNWLFMPNDLLDF